MNLLVVSASTGNTGKSARKEATYYWQHVPSHQRIAVPLHKSVNVGTLNDILRTVAAHEGTAREAILKTIL
jgi:hypothetical protein